MYMYHRVRMEANPSVVVVSCSDVLPQTIVEKLRKHINVNEIDGEGNESKYLWHVDTKYYTAEVNIQTAQTSTTTTIRSNIEAMVIHFDSSHDEGLDNIKDWKEFITLHGPDVKLLIADVCNDTTKITNVQAIEWCLEHGFELIELHPSKTSSEEEHVNDVIKETSGIQRVIEALQTHVWSNLVMKSKSREAQGSDEASQRNSSSSSSSSNSRIEHMLDSLSLDDDQMEFSELFQRLHAIKESVQSMSISDRRHCAEQVVAAFWRVIGGDEDEIENI